MAEALKQHDTYEFHKVFGEYIGQHIYLASNKNQTEILATGKTPLLAIKRAHERGYKHPIIILAPQDENCGYLL